MDDEPGSPRYDDDNITWITELENALLEGCDFGVVRNICNGRGIPEHCRSRVWKICLNVMGKGDAFVTWDGARDLTDQETMKSDIMTFYNSDMTLTDEQSAVVNDIEALLTLYCKTRNINYNKDNGWLNILQPFHKLRLSRADMYNCFYAMTSKFIPRDCDPNGQPFHLFRLLLLYHDSDLCSFLDTKQIHPELYARKWFQTLFSATAASIRVVQTVWDVYLQSADPFLVFFLALVIVINAKEQIMIMEEQQIESIIETISSFPCALEEEDIEDFCSLAQYYAERTPNSYRKDYQVALFGSSIQALKGEKSLSQALCLDVSLNEVLQCVNRPQDYSIQFFVIDCRPTDQYNSGHLPTAFHLDANLMLQESAKFSEAVAALFESQKQALAVESLAGGQHLCFLGSGREQEDQYVTMVVSYFLQRHSQYISIARGGYRVLHDLLKSDLQNGLADHNELQCLMCNPNYKSRNVDETDDTSEDPREPSMVGRLTSAFKSKSANMKDKFSNFLTENAAERHVNPTDHIGKPYRGVKPVFSINDDDDDNDELPHHMGSDDEQKEVVNIKLWSTKPDIDHCFTCQCLKTNGELRQGHLLLTKSHMYIIRNMTEQPGMGVILGRRPYISIVKITSKRKHPDLITFKYGSTDSQNQPTISHMDRFLIPDAAHVTNIIKEYIITLLDNDNS